MPEGLVVINGSEAALALLAMLLFLYPGLLSDVVGYALALPRLNEKFRKQIVQGILARAKEQGKSVVEMTRDQGDV